MTVLFDMLPNLDLVKQGVFSDFGLRVNLNKLILVDLLSFPTASSDNLLLDELAR